VGDLSLVFSIFKNFDFDLSKFFSISKTFGINSQMSFVYNLHIPQH
jgi:hypothetical protein